MTDRELMQQAVEALEADEYDMVPDQEGHMVFRKEAAINALRDRLAQPEQEPVLWRNAAIRVGEELSSVGPDGYYNMTAQQWLDWVMAQDPRGKNSLAQPEQEPVAWVYPEGVEALNAGKPWTAYGTRQEPNNIALYLSPQPDIPPYAWVTFTPYGDEDDVWYENPEGQLPEGWTYKPLYDTTPPQRTWVDLTDEEIKEIIGPWG